jgi:hypothetical protein
MIMDIIEDINYRKLMEKQIGEIIDYLLENNEEFSITANISGTIFNPAIPTSISSSFSKFTMFTLSNYTYSTIVVLDDSISFEAGFGEENFGSTVTIPLYAIFQIVIHDSILFVNPTATVNKYFINKNNNEKDQRERSRKAFKMNPKNKNLIDT